MDDSTMFNIIMAIVLIGIAAIILLAVDDYYSAKETCSELKSEEDCSYEICMAEEYKSSEEHDKVDSCILELIYKRDVVGEKDDE